MATESTPSTQGSAAYSSVTLNANKGADAVDFQSAVVTKSTIGLGAGDDTLTGQFNTLTTATIAGGKGEHHQLEWCFYQLRSHCWRPR